MQEERPWETAGSTRIFLAIVLAYCAYAAVFIYQTSFVIEGKRFFSLFDDGMVSMRYAKNLAQGNGLVWNPGERVEGFTNPLWVLFMTLFHCLPLDPSKISVAIQISGALFLVLNLVFVKKIAEQISSGSAPVTWAAVVLTAFYLPLNNWSLQGMEVSALTCIVTASVWKALQGMKEGRPPVAAYLWLGVGTLIRPDMVAPFVAVLFFLLGVDHENRKANLCYGFAILGFFILLQTAFRLWYYGDILPNTYYLKVTGYPALGRILRGLYVFTGFVLNFNPILFFAPFALFFLRRDRATFLLFWVFLCQAGYSVYVGGDAWEWWGGSNRYLCLVIPLFFILLSHALVALLEEGYKRYASPRVIEVSLLAVLLFTLIGLNDQYRTPLQLARTAGIQMMLVLALAAGLETDRRRASATADERNSQGSLVPAPPQRRDRRPVPHFKFCTVALLGISLLNVNAIHGRAALAEWLLLEPPLHAKDNKAMVERALLLKQITAPDAKIAVVWAGATPYFADRHAIDLLGKNDKKIARAPMRPSIRIEPNNTSDLSQWLVYSSLHRFNQFYPGHLKWNYAYSIGQLQPDVIVQLWRAREEAAPFLNAAYQKVTLDRFNFYLRVRSPRILWTQVNAQLDKDRYNPPRGAED